MCVCARARVCVCVCMAGGIGYVEICWMYLSKCYLSLLLRLFVCLLQRLRRLSTKYRTEKIYPTNVGEQEENVKKNRYKDILPCE